jgi:glycerol-3-phosphate O-acyltransferase
MSFNLHVRNNLMHLFCMEGMIACALHLFEKEKQIETVQLIKEAEFLRELLSFEFVIRPPASNEKVIH